MNGETIEVHFIHPRTSIPLTADISPQCTGQEALEELQADDGTGAFLAPPPNGSDYKLVLTRGQDGIEITPTTTFAQVGVGDGDTVEVRVEGRGAGDAPQKG